MEFLRGVVSYAKYLFCNILILLSFRKASQIEFNVKGNIYKLLEMSVE